MRNVLTTPTLHLCMVTWSGLVSSNRPLLKDWAEVFEEKWQSKVCGLGTVCIRLHKELSTIGRVVMWQHLYRTVWNSDLGTSEVEYLVDFWIKHAHHLTAIPSPPEKIKQLNTILKNKAQGCLSLLLLLGVLVSLTIWKKSAFLNL